MVNFSLRAFVAFFTFLSVSTVCAQTKVVIIPLFGDDAPAPTVYAIGDTGPAGGVVFDLTNGGLNGLEAAPVDQVMVPWNCSGTDVVGVENIASASTLDTNSGAANTTIIAVACGGAAAATAVYLWPNGQADGFLPNKEELSLLHANKDFVGNFLSREYWSSSESSNDRAWALDFLLDNNLDVNKSVGVIGVRAIRAF